MLNETQKKLVEDNHNLIFFFGNKYKLDMEEWYDILAIALCKAAEGWSLNPDENKVAFSTFVGYCMKRHIMNQLRDKEACKRIPSKLISSGDKTIWRDNEESTLFTMIEDDKARFEEEVENRIAFEQFHKEVADSCKKERWREMFYMWIDKGMSEREIGNVYGITGQQVHKTKKRIINNYKKKYAV